MIIIQPKIPFLGVVFDEDHDFEGPRFPKTHLDTVDAIGNLPLTGGSIILQKKPGRVRSIVPIHILL